MQKVMLSMIGIGQNGIDRLAQSGKTGADVQPMPPLEYSVRLPPKTGVDLPHSGIWFTCRMLTVAAVPTTVNHSASSEHSVLQPLTDLVGADGLCKVFGHFRQMEIVDLLGIRTNMSLII